MYNIFEGLAPLLCTGNSATVPALFNRYLSTVVQIKSWFEGDPFDPSSKAYRSLKVVRSFHRQVAAKLNEGKVEGKDELWMSQWSMMGAQFTFMGYMAVFPKEVSWRRSLKKGVLRQIFFVFSLDFTALRMRIFTPFSTSGASLATA